MTFLKWFGIEKIDKHLKIELDLLQSILDDVSDIEKLLENLGERKEKIDLALAKRGKNLKKGLTIQKVVEKTL